MPIIEIKQASNLGADEVRDSLIGRTLVADTNFLLALQTGKALVKETFDYANNNGTLFFQNVTVHQELMNRLFKNIVGEKLAEFLKLQELTYLIKQDEKKRIRIDDRKLKAMRETNSPILAEAAKELEAQLLQFADFPYLSSYNFPKEEKIEWEKTKKLIYEYYLSPNDAMIANFALTPKVIDGLITCDNDFKYCKEFENSSNKFLIVVGMK